MSEHPLRTYRREHGLTLEALADRAEIGASTISRIERGLLRPSFDLLRRLVGATGSEVTAEMLLDAPSEAA